MKKIIYVFILIFFVFGCSSNAKIEKYGQQLNQLDEPQKEITPKQQLDSVTVKEDTEIPDDQNQKDQKLKSCKLSGGELVEDGWAGKDTGSNYCNQCKCMNGNLACTKMACLDNDSSVKAPVRDVSQQDDSKAKSEEDERKKDEKERKKIEEDERKKEEANQPEIILKVYGNVEQHKIESAQKAIDNLDIVSSDIKVPVYVLLWEVNEERGLDEQNAELLTDFIISKFFPAP
jgi:PBP1b-binding outer membrane lipoprotein LpoB